MIAEALHKLVVHRQDLTREDAREAMNQILGGQASDIQIAAFLVALHMKGESVEEIVGFAQAIRSASRLSTDVEKRTPGIDVSGTERDALVDTCGTGGGVSGTFNISTVTAFIVAGAGVRVAKHGNRSITSRCGSADVVEALGIHLTLSKERLKQCLEEVGIAFLFAPSVHSAMKCVQAARRELKLPTVFNLLGPLTNPANASAQVVGVYSADIVEKLAQALAQLGVRRAFVVHGCDCLDEITITERTLIAEVRAGNVNRFELSPEEFGMPRAPLADIMGGDADENATIVRTLLRNESPDRTYEAKRNVVLLNAAAALAAAGVEETIGAALAVARHSLESGAAFHKLEKLQAFTSSP